MDEATTDTPTPAGPPTAPPAPQGVLRGARWDRRPGTSGRPAGGGGGSHNRAVGTYGERRAAAALEDAGLVVVDRNWRCELGEIDLVALDCRPGPGDPLRRAREVVVCEVKTRTSTRFGAPAAQVTAAKAARLRALGRRWTQEHPAVAAPLRVDVVGVLVPRAGAPVVTHLRGVA